MREQVGITSEFSCRRSVVYSEEAQKALLVHEQKNYCSAEDVAPADLEDLVDPSMPNQAYPLPLLTYKIDFSDAQSRKHFTKQQSVMCSREYWLIPVTILLKLESADLTFTTLIGGKVSGKGTKMYHHNDPGAELLQASADRRAYELDDADENDQDEHGVESELGRIELGD